MATDLPLSRVQQLLALHPDAPVRVYTLQHPGAVAAARSRGYLTCDPAYAFEAEDDPSDSDAAGDGFAAAYRWIKDRMAERIDGFSGDFPVFCWLKRPSAKPLPASFGPMMRVSALVPCRRILLSWHDGFLTIGNTALFRPPEHFNRTSMASAEIMTDDGGETSRQATETSWHGILDVANPAFWPTRRRAHDLVQACVDRIYLDEVYSIRSVPTRNPSGKILQSR